jgi:hypothetical protein
MFKRDLLVLANEKFLAILLLVISFLPLEPSCLPGNRFLLVTPFVYLGVRLAINKKLKKNDIGIILGFAVLVVLMALLAALTDCTPGYVFTDIMQPEWQRINIDSLGPDGTVYIRNIKSLQIATSDILVHVNDTQVPCDWEGSARYIAPGETKYCKLPITCTENRSVLIEVFAPGNNDSVRC